MMQLVRKSTVVECFVLGGTGGRGEGRSGIGRQVVSLLLQAFRRLLPTRLREQESLVKK